VIELVYPPGATPIDADEAAALLPSHIATQEDLNAWEEANILQGERWAFRQRRRDVLDEGFVRTLHKKMFDRTWRWAGKFRVSDKNIGVAWSEIAVRLRDLLDDARYQVERQTYTPDETAIRLHHRLVWIHAFPNGNGRHSRLLTDVLATRLGRPRFSWGSAASLAVTSGVRARYIEALQAADRGRIELLLAFARA